MDVISTRCYSKHDVIQLKELLSTDNPMFDIEDTSQFLSDMRLIAAGVRKDCERDCGLVNASDEIRHSVETFKKVYKWMHSRAYDFCDRFHELITDGLDSDDEYFYPEPSLPLLQLDKIKNVSKKRLKQYRADVRKVNTEQIKAGMKRYRKHNDKVEKQRVDAVSKSMNGAKRRRLNDPNDIISNSNDTNIDNVNFGDDEDESDADMDIPITNMHYLQSVQESEQLNDEDIDLDALSQAEMKRLIQQQQALLRTYDDDNNSNNNNNNNNNNNKRNRRLSVMSICSDYDQ